MADATPPTGRPADDLLVAVEQAIARLQSHADPEVRADAQTILDGVDAVHRTALTHLVQALAGAGGDTLINSLIADPAIRLLLMSYDLVAVDRRLLAEEAVDTVRGHLHDHGVDVQIDEVVGGVVYVRLHVSPREGRPAPTPAAVRADLEAALRESFAGFQELEIRDGAARAAVPIVAIADLRRANRPVYEDVAAAADVVEGRLRGVTVGTVPILLARVDGDIYAARNQCGDSPLPLDLGVLDGAEVRCAWHGCRYDLRSGLRRDGPGRIQVFPVSVAGGRVRVAIGVQAGSS